MDELRPQLAAWEMEGIDTESIVSVIGSFLDAEGENVSKEYSTDRATIVVEAAGDLCTLNMYNVDGCDGIFYRLSMRKWHVDLMIVRSRGENGAPLIDKDFDVHGDLSTIVEDFVTLRLHV
jgi:hypothetical protein